MPLVSAKCTSCGATLEVDNSKEAAVCPYCGTVYIVEKAINTYNTTYRYNVENLSAGVVNINTDGSAQARINAGNGYMRLKEYSNAYKAFSDAASLTPQNPQTWWGCLRARTHDFTNTSTYSGDLNTYQNLAKKAFEFMEEEEKTKYSATFYNYIRPLNLALGNDRNAMEQESSQADKVRDDANAARNARQREVDELDKQIRNKENDYLKL